MINSIPSLPHNSQLRTSLRNQSDLIVAQFGYAVSVVCYQKVVDLPVNNVHLYKAPLLQVGMKFVINKIAFLR